MATTALLGQGMTVANRPAPSQLTVPHPYPFDFAGPKIITEDFAAQGIGILIPTHPVLANLPLYLNVIPSVEGAAVQMSAWSYNRTARVWLNKTVSNEDGTNPYGFVIPSPGLDPLYFSLDSVSLNASVDMYFDPGKDNLWVVRPDPYTSINPAGIAPKNTVAPEVTGTATVGSVLTCSTGTWTGSPTPTFAYQWLRNGLAIAGATNNTYTVQSGDSNTGISCRVTASNSISSATANSNTRTISAAPVNTVAPVISGTPTIGQQLTATAGTWTGTAPITYGYQWRRNGSDIAGAIGTTYTLVNADASSTITCAVTASNGQGSTTAVSNSISVGAVLPSLDFSLPSNSQYIGVIAA